MPLTLFFLLFAVSAVLGLCVLAWCARLARAGNWRHCLLVLAAGLLAGLTVVGLLLLLMATFGENVYTPRDVLATVFAVGFSSGSFAMAVSLGLWPFVKGFVYQSRRWADRK
jgi:hypothetical protein